MSQSPLDTLSENEQQALAQLAKQKASNGITRRGALKGAGILGLGSLVGGGGVLAAQESVEPVSAQAAGGNVGNASSPVDVFAESVDAEDVDNIVMLPEVDGTSLNAKWDNIRSGWTAGESKYVVIPPVDESEDSGRTDVLTLPNGRDVWRQTGALTITNAENNLWLVAGRSNIGSDGVFPSFIDISDGSNKPENIDIWGGFWRNIDGDVTDLLTSTGFSRVRLHSMKAGSNGTDFRSGIRINTDDHPAEELVLRDFQGEVFSDSGVYVEGTNNPANNPFIDGVRSNGQDAVRIVGAHNNPVVKRVRDTGTGPSRSRVRFEVTANGRTDHGYVEDVCGFQNIPSVQIVDTSGGTGTKHRELAMAQLETANNETIVDADYVNGLDVSLPSSDLNYTVALDDVEEANIDAEFPGLSVTTTANTVRAVINGWGVNNGNPTSTGQWFGNGYEGLRVLDTTGPTKYLYRNAGWV